MKIENYSVGINSKPLIIAEMSGNHNQSLDRALEIVDAAANSGADAIKLQTYTADTITLDIKDKEFLIDDDESLWSGKTLHELYSKAYTPWEWHKPIMDRAKDLGIFCFSSPFDETAVDFLENLNVPAYKIASFENNHIPLIKKVASTGKPVIISTGMATVSEIHEAVTSARESGCRNLVLLKCTSTYPASPLNSNIMTIPHMKELFGCEVGLSDHTLGIGASLAAVAHGATVIEKHFCLDRSDGGVDSSFSLEPNEFKNLVIETNSCWQSLGGVLYGGVSDEDKSKTFRRSLYVAEDMKAGEIFTKSNLRVVRPGLGLPPKYYDLFLGKSVNKDLKKGTPVNWSYI
jgi:pseudaminic acid synthase